MKRRFILLIVGLLALFPGNIFAAPYPSDINTGVVRLGTADRFLVGINNSYYYAFGSTSTTVFYRVSFDGGVSWSTDTAIDTTAGTVGTVAVWYDRWTPGNTGTIIHIAWTVSGSAIQRGFYYRRLDVQDNTLSTETAITTVVNTDNTSITVTRAIGGNLYAATGSSVSTLKFFRSTNDGSSWAARAAYTVGSTGGPVTLIPSNNTSENNDVFFCSGISAQPLECQFYGNTANTWGTELTIGSANLRVADSVGLALDGNGTIWLSGSFVNGSNEDIKTFICPVNCSAPTERGDILTDSAFTGVVTRTRLTVYGIGGLQAAVIISGRTATSGIEVSQTTNNGGSWGLPSRFNQSNLSTQVLIQAVTYNSQITAGPSGVLIPVIWNYTSPGGAYFFNLAVSQGAVAATPTPISRIWYERLTDTTTNNDQGWGRTLWMAFGIGVVMVLLMLVHAPVYTYLAAFIMGGIAYLSIEHIPSEVGLIAVMLVGLILAIAVITKGKSEDKL